MYNVDGVMIDVGVKSDKAAAGLEKLAATLNRVKTAASGSVGLENVRKQIDGANNSLNKFKGFTRSLVSIAAVTKLISASVTKSNEYVESLNLFRVALGSYADEAERYAKTVEDVMGIDSSEWMRNQGTFMQIASGFGMAADQAYTLSKALTQVSYDIASFYNISTKEAMAKVRSGISGELEPLRNLGYALDTATLQQIAYANGITQKVNTMTQAQKAELRYVAIMSQSKNAINDMSRTFMTSANQIRVLTGQINVLARAFGNILIPAINAVLPVVIMFVNTLSTALNAIAKLFGFAIPSVDWGSSGLSDASDAAGDLGSNLGGATGSAKKLKKVLMGFDELNVMPDVGGGGGGGGGAGGLGGFGGSLGLELEDYMYDFLDGMYSKVKKLNSGLLGVIAGVAGLAIPAATMLGWKNLSNIIGGMITAYAQFRLNFELTEAYLKTGDGEYLLESTGLTLLAGGILTTIFRNAGMTQNGAAWRYGFSSALAIDVGATLYALYEGVKEGETQPFSKESIITSVVNIVKAGLAGYLVGGVAGALIGIGLSTSATLSVIALAVEKHNNAMLYGDVRLTAEEIRKYAQALLRTNVNATVSLIKTRIDGVEEAKANLNSAIASLQTSTNLIRLGIDTSEPAYTALKNDAVSVINEANNLLTEQERTLGVMLQLMEPTDGEGNTMNQQLQSAATNAISALRTGYQDLGGQLMDAIQAGMDTGEFESKLIADLTTAIINVSTAVSQGEIMGAYKADIALVDLDKESFNGVLEEIENVRNELRASYTDLAREEYYNLTGQLSGLKQLQDYYYTDGNDINAGNALQSVIDNLAAQIEAYNIPEKVEQMMANTLVGEDDVIGNALIGWIDKSGNNGKFAKKLNRAIDHYYAGFAISVETGQYASTAAYIADAIETAFADVDVNLSELGLTGMDFVSSEFRGVIDEALRQAAIPQETIDDFWSSISNNPNWDKIGEVAAKKSIEAIKSQYSKAEQDAKEIANNFADNITEYCWDIDYDAMISESWGDYSHIAANIVSYMNEAFKDSGIDLSQMSLNGTELLTDEFRQRMGDALKNAGIPQGSIDAIWSEFSRIFGNGIITSIKNSKTGAVSAIGSVISAIKAEAKKNTIKFKLGLTSDGSSATISGGGVNKSINIVTKYASGGIPDYGSIFIAGEPGAGPELVGKIGNKTGVVNSGQISEIIAAEMARNGNHSGNEDAVANAVAAALSNMELKVDGDSFGRIAVKTINKRRQTSGRVELIL